MSSHDVVRSVLREWLERGASALYTSDVADKIRTAFGALSTQAVTIDAQALGRVLSRQPGVEAVVVRLSDGAIRIQATLAHPDGAEALLNASLYPERVRFVPRGAKEVCFRVDPPEAVDDPHCRAFAGAVGAVLAERLWGVLAAGRKPNRTIAACEAAHVDQDGSLLTMDLRSVPFVRALRQEASRAMLLEVLRCDTLTVEADALRVRLRFFD